jgi:hypothetical protein
VSLIYPPIIDFDKSIIKYPNITRYVGGASTDLVPDLQHPDNPVPLLKDQIDRLHIGAETAADCERGRVRIAVGQCACRCGGRPKPLPLHCEGDDVGSWPAASNVVVQANVGLLVNCGSGSRVLEASKVTRRRHNSDFQP